MLKKIAKFIAAWIFIIAMVTAMCLSDIFTAVLMVAIVIGATSVAIWTIVNEN